MRLLFLWHCYSDGQTLLKGNLFIVGTYLSMLLFKEYFAVLEYHDFTSPVLKEGLPGTILTLVWGRIHAGEAALQDSS